MPETVSPYAATPIAEVPRPPNRRCVVCASEIEFEAKKCVKCSALQEAKECLVCAARIPLRAERCGSCSTFQRWLRRKIPGSELVLTLLLSLISVTTAIFPRVIAFVNRPSRTTAVFIGTVPDAGGGTSNDLFMVRVYNSGGLPSVVERARLQYPAAGVEPAALPVVNVDQIEIPGNGKADLKLDLEALQISGPPAKTMPERNAAKARVGEQICKSSAALQVWVKERDRWGTLHAAGEPLRITLPGKQIRDAVLQRIAGEAPKGCS